MLAREALNETRVTKQDDAHRRLGRWSCIARLVQEFAVRVVPSNTLEL